MDELDKILDECIRNKNIMPPLPVESAEKKDESVNIDDHLRKVGGLEDCKVVNHETSKMIKQIQKEQQVHRMKEYPVQCPTCKTGIMYLQSMFYDMYIQGRLLGAGVCCKKCQKQLRYTQKKLQEKQAAEKAKQASEVKPEPAVEEVKPQSV